jgi:hypothetical protein
MSWRPATTIAMPASSGRKQGLTLRLADYFGLSYPHEFSSACSLFIALIFLRVATTTHYKFAIDESQHLHVVWGWARGFVQYRDLADNHMPLFHILCAPIYKLIGELTRMGKGVILVSPELEELMGLCNRIYIMFEGAIMDIVEGERKTQEVIINSLLGVKGNE